MARTGRQRATFGGAAAHPATLLPCACALGSGGPCD
jgi:hypothetical protein